MNKEEIEKLKEKVSKYGLFNYSDIYGGNKKYEIEIEEIINFVNKLLEAQNQDLLKKKKEDLKFLKEMYECSQKLLNEKYDIVILEHLNKMIEDWKDEALEDIKKLKIC